MSVEIIRRLKNKKFYSGNLKTNESEHHSHEYRHPDGKSCEIHRAQTTLFDRALMLLIALIISFFVFKPYLSFQSYMRGFQYTEAAKSDLAIKHLRRAVQMDNTNDLAWSLLGYNYLKTDEKESALKAYERALSLNPHDVQAAVELSLVYLNEGNLKEAISTLEKHLIKDPLHINGWILLGSLYEKAGRTEEARSTWETIYKVIDPGNIVARDKLNQLNIQQSP